MLVSRKKPHSGRSLKTFPIAEDHLSHRMGFKIGYCIRCSDEVIIPFAEANEIALEFGAGLNKYQQAINKLTKEPKPKIPLSLRLAKWLVKGDRDLAKQLIVVEDDFRSG